MGLFSSSSCIFRLCQILLSDSHKILACSQRILGDDLSVKVIRCMNVHGLDQSLAGWLAGLVGEL